MKLLIEHLLQTQKELTRVIYYDIQAQTITNLGERTLNLTVGISD